MMKDRRQFLRATGLSLPFLTGCSGFLDDSQPATERATRTGTATEAHTTSPDRTGTDEPTAESLESRIGSDLRSRFDTVYDVTEHGADPSGGQRVDDVVEELATDDTLLYFPTGRYLIGSVLVEGVRNVGLLGEDTTFEIDEPGQNIYLSLRNVADILVDGFTVDNTGANEAAAVDLKCTGGTNRFRNYAVDGFVDVPERTFAFTLMVQGADSDLTLSNVDLSQGGTNAGAVFVFPQRDFYDPDQAAGSLTFRDCVMQGWGKEGLYASAHSGPLRVLGGEYANNAIVQVRVGGGNAPTEAVVRDVTVRATEIPDYMPANNRLLRGIWLKEGDGALIENCEIQVQNLGRTQTQGGIVVNDQFGRVRIRDCEITSSVPRPAVVAENPVTEYDSQWMPSLDRLPEEWSITVEDTSITSSISDIEAVHIVGRDGSLFRNVTVEQLERGGDGIQLHRTGSCRIEDSTIDAQRFPVAVALPESSDDCVVHLARTTIAGRSAGRTEQVVATNTENRFCVQSDPIDGTDPAPRQLLGLTRTGTAGSTGETTTRDSQAYVLFGRLFDR